MAKLRVYELARDLNMKNKVLLDKISEMNIVVSSHMSSLDDDTVNQIKAYVLGKKKAKTVDEKRIGSTVIRRRKKSRDDSGRRADLLGEEAAIENDFDEGVPDTDADVAEAPSDTPFHQRENAGSPVGASDIETDATDQPTGAKAAGPSSERKDDNGEAEPRRSKRKKRKKNKGEFASAKIISQPKSDDTGTKSLEASVKSEEMTAESGQSVMRAKTTDAEEADLSEASAGASPPDVEAEEEAMNAAGPVILQGVESEAESQEEPTMEDESGSSSEETADGEASESSDEDDDSEKNKGAGKKKKRRRKSKKEKETPAKIIKLPEEPVEASADEALEAPEDSGEDAAAGVPAGDSADQDEKGKKRKKRVVAKENDASEVRRGKKKASFKRREVVEGSELYADGGGRSKKQKKGKARPPKPQKTQITTPKAIKRRIKIDETIVLAELAKRMGIKASEMIKRLMMMGVMVTVNQTIDFDTASLVASEFGYEVESASFEEDAILNFDAGADDPEKMAHRAPVVTIMGHVDHGKTSLLDVIRKTRVTEGEAGGITQHIGAYNVETEGGRITFLDTPGHEAFTAMRARGATVTDIVVLVVAADDGVMPQTIEAINHARAAEVPIIVAVNKMDKPGADPDRVQRELAEQGLLSESWGGDTIFVHVSAKQNQGIEELLDMILLQAEVLELKANPEKHAKGYVVEAKLDAGRGPVATVLIQEGELHAGEPVVCGLHYGKVRAMYNDVGQLVEKAGPSLPVEILGLSGVPESGDELVALEDDRSAKQVSEFRLQKQRSKELAKTSRMSLEKLFEQMQEGEVKDLNIILRADVHGSIEALRDSLLKLSNDEVKINIVHAAAGTVNESDVSLATVTNAIIIGFNVRPTPKVQAMAIEEHVDMRFHNIIYNVIKEVEDAIVGMMDSTFEERMLGSAEVRQVFHVPKVGTIAGCYVKDGTIERGKKIRIVRDGVIIHEGSISSLKRYKDDAKEVAAGYECGIGVENYNDIKVGDWVECYYIEEIKPGL